MAAPVIVVYPGIVPLRTQPQAEFSVNTGDLLTWFTEVVPEINTSVLFVNDTSISTNILAQSTADLATTIITTADFVGGWDNLTGSLAIGKTVSHISTFWQSTIALADVTLSEPSLGNTDWILSAQNTSRATVTTPFTLITPGRYLIIGSGIITVPNPNTLTDGQTFNFKRVIGDIPTIQVGVAVDVFKFDGLPDDDGVQIDDVNEVEITVRSNFYEV